MAQVAALIEALKGALKSSLIATRKDIEREISAVQLRVASREQQIATLAPQQRTQEILLLAARDIAANEAHLQALESRHVEVAQRVSTEELTLRNLLTEIREHRREVKILASDVARSGLNKTGSDHAPISADGE